MWKTAVAVGLLCVAGQVAGQTTNCQWIGNVWSCSQVPELKLNPPVTPVQPVLPRYSPPDFSQLPNPSQVGQGMMDSFRAGQEMARREAEAKALLERQRAETEYLRSQKTQSAPQAIKPQEEFTASLEDRKLIGQMLQNGNCAGAIDKALNVGDIELAVNVKAFCNGVIFEDK